MYTINFNTGIGNQTAQTLEEAKLIADQDCQYTQADITIEKEDKVIARGRWWPVEFDEEVDDSQYPILYGTFGYYADWVEITS